MALPSVIALVYVALQARAVLAQPRSGVVHSLIEILVSLLPLFVVGYAAVDWLRGNNALNVFQVIVMVQATLATLIEGHHKGTLTMKPVHMMLSRHHQPP